ncbi:MAG: hypothetical protein KGI27_10090 [Thaumarchaeota archaeon]|nr:hypothetical protein [Nitrososphaerota archaeon]
MLTIKGYKDAQARTWYVGDPWPETTGYGVEIRADGHELTWLMDAIREGRAKATAQYYKETWGSHK